MGFGKEIKDFISAYQAGNQIQGAKDDRAYKKARTKLVDAQATQATDPDMLSLAKQRLQAQVNYFNGRANYFGNKTQDPQLSEGRSLDNQLRRLQIKALQTPQPGPADGAGAYAPPDAPVAAPGPQSALDVQQPVQIGENDQADAPDTAYSAVGGPVTRKGYADGGAVEDDEDTAPLPKDESDISPDDADQEDYQDQVDEAQTGEAGEGALPIQSAAPAAPAKGKPSGKTVAYSPEAAHDAVIAGLKFAAMATGHDGTPNQDDQSAIPDNAKAAAYRASGTRKYLSGGGATAPNDFNAVLKAVDPEGKLSEGQRNMAALSTVYQWNLTHKSAQEADGAAAQMTQYLRMQSDRYKAMAQAAANGGNLDRTMQDMVRSYASVPTGDDLKLEKDPKSGAINWSVTDDQTGETKRGGVMSPDQLLSWATKGGMPTFDELLMHSASGRAELASDAKANKGAKGLKPADSDKIDNDMDAAVGALPDQGKSLGDQLGPLRAVGFQIKAANSNINKDDALGAAMELTQVKDPNAKPTFSVLPKDQQDVKGQIKIQLGSGDTIALPNNVVNRLRVMRQANMAVAQKAAEDAKTKGDAMGRVVTGVKNIATNAMNAPASPVPADVAAARTMDTLRNAGAALTAAGISPQEMAARIAQRRAAQRGFVSQGALPINQGQ